MYEAGHKANDEKRVAQHARTRPWSPLLGSSPPSSLDALVFGGVALVLLSLLCTCHVITRRDREHKKRALRFCPPPKTSTRLPATRRALLDLRVDAVQVRAAPLPCLASHAPSLTAQPLCGVSRQVAEPCTVAFVPPTVNGRIVKDPPAYWV